MLIHMKTFPFLQLLAMVCCGGLISCADQHNAIKGPAAATRQADVSASAQIFQAVNAYRRSIGAADLQRHAGLDHIAQQHCEYLREHRGTFEINGKNVSHIGFEGRALYARNVYHMGNLAENVVAANHATNNPGPAAVALWKNSKSHHQTMIDSWPLSGVGAVVDGDGTVFAVQLFGVVNASRNRF